MFLERKNVFMIEVQDVINTVQGWLNAGFFRCRSPEGSRGSVWGGAARLCQVFRGELIDSEFITPIKIRLTCLYWMWHGTTVSVSGEIWFKAPVDAALPSSGCPTPENTQDAYIQALKWSLILIMSIWSAEYVYNTNGKLRFLWFDSFKLF